VIEAEQTKDGKKERNDRLIAVAEGSLTHGEVESINDLDETLVKEIEHFLSSTIGSGVRNSGPLADLGRNAPRGSCVSMRERKNRRRGIIRNPHKANCEMVEVISTAPAFACNWEQNFFDTERSEVDGMEAMLATRDYATRRWIRSTAHRTRC